MTEAIWQRTATVFYGVRSSVAIATPQCEHLTLDYTGPMRVLRRVVLLLIAGLSVIGLAVVLLVADLLLHPPLAALLPWRARSELARFPRHRRNFILTC